MDKVRKLLEHARTNLKAVELIKGLKRPKSDKQAIDGYMDIAKAMDMDITEEELVQGLKDVAEAQKAKTAEAAERIGIEENNLEQVAGGEGEALRGCSSTHSPGEWCWIDDSCAWAISSYDDTGDSWEANPRDSMWDPQEGDEGYECENLAEWEIIE